MTGMQTSRRKGLARMAALLGVAAALCAWRLAAAIAPAEQARIERLIRHVAAQQGMRFLRNGESHDAAGAAAHLRAKLEQAGDKVRTVDDFIDGVASKSWLSGQAYRVKLADGRELAARDWLRAELKRLETGTVTR